MNKDNQKALNMAQGDYIHNKSSQQTVIFAHDNPHKCSLLERFLNFIELIVTVPIIIITPFLWIGKLFTWIGEKGLGL